MTRVWAVVEKEWTEARRNRMLVLPILIPVVVMTLVPILALRITVGPAGSSARNLPPGLGTLPPQEALGIFLASQVIILFLIMPVIIPMTLAAASIIGEKQNGSLEPLLATPIETWELLVGKCLAAAGPAVVLTWVAYAVFLLATVPVVGPAVRANILGPTWLLALLLVAPLLGVLGVGIAIVISSRVNDVRIAQQTGGLVALPLVAVAIGQSAGLFLVNPRSVAVAAVIVAALDLLLLRTAVRLFQREAILTQWH